jgi:hypothetical protein
MLARMLKLIFIFFKSLSVHARVRKRKIANKRHLESQSERLKDRQRDTVGDRERESERLGELVKATKREGYTKREKERYTYTERDGERERRS